MEPTSANRPTIPNNQLDIIIHDNKKGTCMLIDAAIPKDRNVIKKDTEKILKYINPVNRNSLHIECESKSNNGNNRGKWNHFKITETVA